MSSTGKIIILSAPSGTGKSTIIGQLMKHPELKLSFSISATSRHPRSEEQHGREYYFLSPEEFQRRVAAGEFVEWEEVYAGTCYGTLHSEIDRITAAGRNVIMDIDVKGGLNLKHKFGDRALALFIMPPSIEELEKRLRGRGTDDDETINRRLAKAEFEMGFAPRFDNCVVNNDLECATRDAVKIISDFIGL